VHNTPQWTLEEYLRRFDHWEAVFIAMNASTYVGYTYLIEGKDAPRVLFQCMTGVRPEYRRRGIGTALKVRGITYAHQRGALAIITRVNASNHASVALNHKLGFRERSVPPIA
jgi:GNAT superfamily N-acetyltransferase